MNQWHLAHSQCCAINTLFAFKPQPTPDWLHPGILSWPCHSYILFNSHPLCLSTLYIWLCVIHWTVLWVATLKIQKTLCIFFFFNENGHGRVRNRRDILMVQIQGDIDACMCTQSCLTPYDPMDLALQAPLSMKFPGKNTGMGCHFLLQGMFRTQGSNLHLLCFLNCQSDSLPAEPPGTTLAYLYRSKRWMKCHKILQEYFLIQRKPLFTFFLFDISQSSDME